MTELEVKQACANMNRQELLNLFTSVEANYNIVYPYLLDYSQTTVDLESANNAVAAAESSAKGIKIATGVFAVLTILFFILSRGAGILGRVLLKFLAIGGLICTIIAVVCMLREQKNYKETVARRDELAAKLPKVKEKMEQMKQQYSTDMLIRQWVCPEGTVNPEYLRIFVSYFESGRADSLKEAYALYDDMRHREKMEGLAKSQIAASYAAADAANNAAAEAMRARIAADSASRNSQ